ncbi:hypothetical protein A3Q56_05224, partial [Intoshia linei]
MDKIVELKKIADKLRYWSIKSTCASNSGHPTSCCSMAEIMSCLFFKVMKYDPEIPKHPCNDRFVLSKGHAAPILYAAWAEAGLFPHTDLLNLRKFSSDLEGHPTPRLSFIDVATGSLGQGINYACGMAYAGLNVDKALYRVYVVIGDGESAEGSVWEAISFAGQNMLSNIVFIFDVNRLGQSEPTFLQHQVEDYANRIKSFGVEAICVDGHNVDELLQAFNKAEKLNKPVALIAKTFKGKGIEGIQDELNWHGKAIPKDKADIILKNFEEKNDMCTDSAHLIAKPVCKNCPALPNLDNVQLKCSFDKDKEYSTREVYGPALVEIRDQIPNLLAFDADTKNSTFSIKLMEKYPKSFCECYIAEQNMVGVGVGAACRGRAVTFTSTFAAFFSRTFDHIRMSAISQSNANFVGSHCGVSIGEDGPSQMGLEDIALFRTIPNCVVFYPSDAVSTFAAMELSTKQNSICFIRTSRPKFKVLYDNDEKFEIGKSKILTENENSKCLLIGGGVTLHECIKASKILKEKGVDVSVLDVFTVKPLDRTGIKKIALQSSGNIIVVEDHYYEGGIGEAICSEFSTERGISIYKLAISEIPHSGKPDELLKYYKIDSQAIVEK